LGFRSDWFRLESNGATRQFGEYVRGEFFGSAIFGSGNGPWGVVYVDICGWSATAVCLRVAMNRKSEVVRGGGKRWKQVVHTAKLLPYEVEKRWAGEGTGGRRNGPVVSDGHPGVFFAVMRQYLMYAE
jgi:hypothetical protein